MNQLIPAEFHGTPVRIIDREGQKWLAAEEIGRCLGYDAANARKGVLKLYERHGDEFTEADTFVVKLTANSRGNPNTRIFSDTGCIKLGFFASTPRAKEFRAWASRVLAGGQAQGYPVAALRQDLALARELGGLRDQVRAQNEMILALYGRVDTAQRGHIRAVTRLLGLEKRQARRERIETALRMEAAGIPREEIVRATGMSFGLLRAHVFRARRDGRLPGHGGREGGAQ